MTIHERIEAIRTGKTSIGIELGSTRIKTVLIGEDHRVLASGSHDWENSCVDNVWTYNLEDVWTGMREATGIWPAMSGTIRNGP